MFVCSEAKMMRRWPPCLAASVALAAGLFACRGRIESIAKSSASQTVADAAAPISVGAIGEMRFAADQPAPREVIDWLDANAIPLATTEAGHGFDDMQPLKQVVGDARIVALGEATHGTREFFQLKHRIFEFLATEMGFTVFAKESGYPAALAIDDYVLHGWGDSADALASVRSLVWDSEEFLDQILWMRRFNSDLGHKQKLRFYGFDMQWPSGAVHQALSYLRKLDPRFTASVAPMVAPLENDFDVENYSQLPSSRTAMAREGVARILKQLDENKNRYLQRSSAGEWEVARMSAKVATQGEEIARNGSWGFRDRSMAENIKLLLEQQPPGARMVVWAHNGHVRKLNYVFGDTMGTHLARLFGPDYVALGFAFNQGSFRARQLPYGKGGFTTFTVASAPSGSLDASLAAAGKLFAIDLRRAPSDGLVAQWLNSPLLHRDIGAAFSYEESDRDLVEEVPRRSYDALLFVDKTSSARANFSSKWTPRPGFGAKSKTQSPINLSFEEVEGDGRPTGWIPYTGNENGGYTVAASGNKPFRGKRCASIAHEGAPWRWGYGALYQNLDAAAYRGKRIRFRAAARAEVLGVGGKAELFLRVFPANARGPASALSIVTTLDHPVRSAKWQSYEVETYVPTAADTIDFGFVLEADGKAWFDDASLEIIDDVTAGG
jgi:erythromycin esterase